MPLGIDDITGGRCGLGLGPGAAAPAASLIVIADTEGRNVYADAAVRAYTGLSGEALKEHGWLDVLHPDDQARAAATWARAVVSGGRYEADYRYRRYDGAYRWFHAKAISDRDASGRIRRWFIVSEEIPERGRA